MINLRSGCSTPQPHAESSIIACLMFAMEGVDMKVGLFLST